jgi:polyisoprenoid-binding protein YceI
LEVLEILRFNCFHLAHCYFFTGEIKMKILSVLLLLTIAYACQPAQEKTEQVPTTSAETSNVVKNCTYTFDAAKTQIKWVAFKTPNKVGVGGAFAKADFQVNNTANMQLVPILSGAKFSVDTKSVSTGNEGRDAKIVEHFFGKGIPLTGEVKAITESAIDVALTMNGATSDVKLNYTFVDGKLEAKGVIDVITAFKMNTFLEAINKACYALHEGKTWSDVEIMLVSEFSSVCQ